MGAGGTTFGDEGMSILWYAASAYKESNQGLGVESKEWDLKRLTCVLISAASRCPLSSSSVGCLVALISHEQSFLQCRKTRVSFIS